jgi:hypothetical protein
LPLTTIRPIAIARTPTCAPIKRRRGADRPALRVADSADVHDQNDIVSTPLTRIPYEQLCPGNAELQKLQNRFR